MKTALLLVLLAVPAYAERPPKTEEPQAHDCRIASLDITFKRYGDELLMRAVYIGWDKQPLTPEFCPDQNPPVWRVNRKLERNPDPYAVIVNDPTGELLTATISTIQRPDKRHERTERFRF